MENFGPDQEGVIKYRLEHRQAALADDLDIAEINAWRSVFHRLRLIGKIPEKYDGLGFGNISRRLVPGHPEFIISGTQTGHLPSLDKSDFAMIESASPERNSIRSTGSTPPSSEALTHASVYLQDRSVNAVIHVHSPELWRQSRRLNLASIAADIPYGTPEMACEVASLLESDHLRTRGIFVMLGHEDGVVAFAATLPDAATLLIAQFAKALALEQNQS